MADDEDFDFDLGGADPTNADWARSRTKFKEERTAREQAEADSKKVARENAFLKAGINPDDPKMGYFVAGYSGDIDPELIKQTAIKDGFISDGTAPDPAAQEARQQAVASQAAITDAAQGGLPPDADAAAALDHAFAEGGDAAIEDQLRAAGIPIRYSS